MFTDHAVRSQTERLTDATRANGSNFLDQRLEVYLLGAILVAEGAAYDQGFIRSKYWLLFFSMKATFLSNAWASILAKPMMSVCVRHSSYPQTPSVVGHPPQRLEG